MRRWSSDGQLDGRLGGETVTLNLGQRSPGAGALRCHGEDGGDTEADASRSGVHVDPE